MTLLKFHSRALLFVSLACIACCSFFSSTALAEPSAADRATARALAREGFDALKKDDFETAEDRFRRADQLVHAPTLVVDHARALVGLGRLVEAHERYSLVLREGVSPNAAWPWKRAYADAQKEIEVIKERLAWLTIQVKGPETPEVSIGGREIPPAAVGVRRATDPGEHTIIVGGEGFHSKEEVVTLTEGEENTIEIELEPKPEEEVLEQPSPEPAVRAAPQGPADAGLDAADPTLAYVALGIGGAGLATWGVTGVLFLRERSTLSDRCVNTQCLDEEQGTIDSYETLGYLSGVAFGIGALGVATGITLLVLDDSTSSPTAAGTEQRTKVAPYFAGNSLGVVGQF